MPNGYDRWDQHIIEASDEPTVQKTTSVEPSEWFRSAVKQCTG
jgi:hypothetical protein